LGKQVLQVFVRWDLLQGVEDDAQHLSLIYLLVNDTGIKYFERVRGSKNVRCSRRIFRVVRRGRSRLRNAPEDDPERSRG